MPNPKLEALLRAIIACLGRNTNVPEITWEPANFQFVVAVDPRDQGRFVGKNGANHWAINALFWYAGLAQIQHIVRIELLSPEEPVRLGPRPFQKNPEWDQTRLKAMVFEILHSCFKTEPKFHIELSQVGRATVKISLDKYLQTPLLDPDFSKAVSTIIYCGGKVDGCSIETVIAWE